VVAVVKVTVPPNSEGFSEEEIPVVVSAGLTTCPPPSDPVLLVTSVLLLVNTALTG
jgi:hypothetical protein